MATRVSCGFAEITISFDMETPHGASDGGGTHARAPGQRGARHCLRSATHGCPGKTCRVAGFVCSPMHPSFQNRTAAGKRSAARVLKSLRAQLTKRRMRTYITRPRDINTKAVAEPP